MNEWMNDGKIEGQRSFEKITTGDPYPPKDQDQRSWSLPISAPEMDLIIMALKMATNTLVKNVWLYYVVVH